MRAELAGWRGLRGGWRVAARRMAARAFLLTAVWAGGNSTALPGLAQESAAQSPATQPTSVNTDWTQWRGPDRTSMLKSDILASQPNLENLERRWRVEVDASYSGPIVAGNKVFVTETKDRDIYSYRG
ncbi:MAG: hypothetical protein ACK53V_26980 [Planctomycetota bacterium]